MKFLKTRITLAIGLLFASTLALGATATDNFGVSATVQDSCQVSASALSFGSFATIDNANVDATTTIDVTCSNGTTYDVGLDAGQATGATVTTRQMEITATGSFLDYSLYSDSGRSTNWGETVDTDTVAGTGTGEAQSLTVYGRVPSGQQTAPVGSYSDTIAVTVTY